MKDGTSFNTVQSMAVLLLGESGVGKSRLAMEWPTPYFCLSDKNIKFAADWAKAQNKRWFYDEPEKELDAAGKPLARHLWWQKSYDLLMAARDNPEVKTLVDDGLTFLELYLSAKILKEGSMAEKPLMVGGQAVFTQSMWNPFYDQMRGRIFDARMGGKPYIMTAHLATRENEVTKVTEYKPAIGGQIRDRIGAFFTEVWQLEAEPCAADKDNPRGVRYIIRTAPTHRLKMLRTTIGLPPVFEPAKSPEFQALLKQLSDTTISGK